MTFREKFEKEHPEGNYRTTCPYYAGYESTPACPEESDGCSMTCNACWNREIPEEKTIADAIQEGLANPDERIVSAFKEMGEAASKTMVALQWSENDQKLADITKNLYKVNSDSPKILDSGNRRQFESGAVRDIQEGKGRCDLLPLDVVAEVLCTKERPFDVVLYHIAEFKDTGKIEQLQVAVMEFGVFSTAFKDLPTMILEVSKHFEEGAKKYGENNWQKGIPVHCYIDSAVRHYLKFLRGDKDEPHDRAFCWNIMCAIWTCKHKPELNEYRVDVPKRDYDPVEKAYDIAKCAYNGDQSNLAYAIEEIVGYLGEALD